MTRDEIFLKYEKKRDNLLKILHHLQDNNPNNYLPEEDLIALADYLGVTMSAVYSTVTYYSAFSLKPRGKNVIKVCEAVICDSNDAEEMLEVIKLHLGISPGEITKDNKFSLQLVDCLGLCHMPPAMTVNRDEYGDLTKEKVIEILDKYSLASSG